MDKRKKLRIFAIVLIVLAFVLEGAYHFKIEPADRDTKQKYTATKETEKGKNEKQKTESDTTAEQDAKTQQTKEQTDKIKQDKETNQTVKEQSDNQTADAKSKTQTAQAETQSIVCQIEIECVNITDQSKVTNAAILPYIPSDGIILRQKQKTVPKGSSVYDVLQQVARENGISVDSDDGYIRGIANIYEFDAGTLSGWMYLVNGKAPNYGCDSYQVQENDVIKWCYTCDLGKDVGGRSN